MQWVFRAKRTNLHEKYDYPLLALLDDILDLSRVEAGRFELQESVFEPADLAAQTLESFRASATLKGLNLVLDVASVPTGCHSGDTLRLRQMLSNYLGNAIKFTTSGSVTVSVSQVVDGAGSPLLEFAVVDTGIGIAADKLHLLFQPFSQVDSSSTRAFGGIGLGLSIVARLAELMGGQVGARSVPGIGSSFWFRVPAKPSARAGLPQGLTSSLPNPSQPICAGRTRILVAEDNAVNCEVLGLLLNSLGAQSDFVHDGQAAVEAITGGARYDLVLMDIQMPVLDGLAATQHVRAWEHGQGRPRVPIVAVTSGAFEDTPRLCREAGMDDFIAKPIGLDELARVLDRWSI